MFKKAGVLLLMLCISLLLTGSSCQKFSEVCLQEHCFQVETASTPTARETGLMFRESLSDKEGMLFIFPKEDIYSFWMKNTKMALDIAWIDSQGTVVFMSKQTQPCKTEQCEVITPTKPAKYVLEIKAGQAENIGLDVGDVLTINIAQEIIDSAK